MVFLLVIDFCLSLGLLEARLEPKCRIENFIKVDSAKIDLLFIHYKLVEGLVRAYYFFQIFYSTWDHAQVSKFYQPLQDLSFLVFIPPAKADEFLGPIFDAS